MEDSEPDLSYFLNAPNENPDVTTKIREKKIDKSTNSDIDIKIGKIYDMWYKSNQRNTETEEDYLKKREYILNYIKRNIKMSEEEFKTKLGLKGGRRRKTKRRKTRRKSTFKKSGAKSKQRRRYRK
jgi:hypothetical protein